MSTPEVALDQGQDSAADDALAAVAAVLIERGVVRVSGRWPDNVAARQVALQIAERARGIDPLSAGLPAYEVVGEFTVPPPGAIQRDFQALHIDYGVPKLAGPAVPVTRFTALYLDRQRAGSGSATRTVSLRTLLGQRSWPPREVLAERVCCDNGDGTLVEGILARMVEAVDQTRDLPDQGSDGFLCGMEFRTLEEEHHYFARHGLCLEKVEEDIILSSGELLVFDNLTTAHGRRGRRYTGELYQLCIGFASLCVTDQAILLDRILAAFHDRHRRIDAATAESRW
jgi:hypothetical protein